MGYWQFILLSLCFVNVCIALDCYMSMRNSSASGVVYATTCPATHTACEYEYEEEKNRQGTLRTKESMKCKRNCPAPVTTRPAMTQDRNGMPRLQFCCTSDFCNSPDLTKTPNMQVQAYNPASAPGAGGSNGNNMTAYSKPLPQLTGQNANNGNTGFAAGDNAGGGGAGGAGGTSGAVKCSVFVTIIIAKLVTL